MVLDRCNKLKQADGDDLVEMNFEFIEDTYNYQAREQNGTMWYARNKSSARSADYEHISKEMNGAFIVMLKHRKLKLFFILKQ